MCSLRALTPAFGQTFKDIRIDGFHSRDLQFCGSQMTKAMTAMLVHITIEVH